MKIVDKYFPIITSIPNQENTLLSIARLRSFTIILIQFLAVFYIVQKYQFEKSSGIMDYTIYIIVAFVVYNFFQIRYRPALLFAFSLVILYSAFGILAASFIVFTGLTFIVVCHLPIKFNFRLALILMGALGMIVFRTEIIFIPWLTMSAMYLAPMFMFRLIIYLVEIKHGLVPASKWQSLVYFFMFPNIFFLFFPIVDYKTYIKTYHNVAEKEIWQKGIRWMLRGLIHVFCYRLLCFNLLLEPSDVKDISTLLQYLVINYTLILRISGIFHFIVGLLCMFGFNLPQLFDNYFTATSFVDLWRRINIYWRDFVLKIFFYPIMFQYKKKIKKNLLAVTMMTVFVITWLLHGYQLFWITGHFPIKLIDIVFWMTIGTCITINSVIIERKSLSGRVEIPIQNNLKNYFVKIIKMMGMLLFMSFMWSLWKSRTFEDWLFLFSKGKIVSSQQIIVIGLVVVLILVLGVLIQVALKNDKINQLINAKAHQTLVLCLTSLTILVLVSFKSISTQMPALVQHIIQNMGNGAPTLIEKENAEIGYYDMLIEGGGENTIGIGSKSFKTEMVARPYADAYFLTNDIMFRRMKPHLKIDGIDHDFQSNSFGIRDKDYSIVKPPGTYRMALLGGSYQMGSGVNNNQVFEAIVEERINKERIDSNHKQIEIFNFAAGGYYLLQQVELINTSVFKYDMNSVIYFAHTDERGKIVHFFANLIKRGLPLKYPFLEYVRDASGAKSYMSALQISELLEPYADVIMKWGYTEIAKKCKENNATPLWAFMPTTTENVDIKEYNELKAYVETLGFVTLDMRDAYGNIDRKEVQLSEWNTHPNVLGHRLIAERFYRELMKNKSRIFKIN